jgi:hypothetical protein
MKGNRNVGGCPSGGGGGETKSPKERYDLIFLSISTEPRKQFFIMLCGAQGFLDGSPVNAKSRALKPGRPNLSISSETSGVITPRSSAITGRLPCCFF